MSSNKRYQTHFQSKWLEDEDENGVSFGDIFEKSGLFSVRCNYCKKEIRTDNGGKSNILKHLKTSVHKHVADFKQGRNKSQRTLGAIAEENEDIDDPEDLDPDDPEPVLNPESTNGNNNNEQASGSGVGIMKFFKRSTVQPSSVTNNNVSIDKHLSSFCDKVSKTEILLNLAGVENNVSFNGMEKIVKVLKRSVDDSKIVEKISLNRTKASYSLSDGLGPHLQKVSVEDIKKSPVFTLGTDTATIAHQGLSKAMDIKIRYFSQEHQRTIDSYVETFNLGHETADILTDRTVKALKELGLDLSKLLVLSRDNPAVMQSFGRKLSREAEKDGNPHIFQAPCILHPTHTGFKKGVSKLNLKADLFLINIHSFFKYSTARREDYSELRNEIDNMEEEVGFFLRHVTSRWLTMGPTAQRVINQWEPLTKYFMDFLFNAKDPASMETKKTDRYNDIVSVLKPSSNQLNLVRLQFIVYLSKKSEYFLRLFQSDKPVTYKLFQESCLLLSSLLTHVYKKELIPIVPSISAFGKVDLNDEDNLIKVKAMRLSPGLEDALKKLGDSSTKLREEFYLCILEMSRYLHSHLPLSNKFLYNLMFSDPETITSEHFVSRMIKIARETCRFSSVELDNLNEQLLMIKLKPIPVFNSEQDRFDEFWMKLIGDRKHETESNFKELEKLIIIICVYPNSNSFLERGFNDSKRISDVRQNLSEESMKAQKLALDAIRFAGGTENVVVTERMIAAHRAASQNYDFRVEKERREKQKAIAEKESADAAKERKRKHDEEKRDWEGKVKVIKDELKVLKETLKSYENSQKKAFDDCKKLQSLTGKSAAIKVAEAMTENIKKVQLEIDDKKAKLTRIQAKRPKL